MLSVRAEAEGCSFEVRVTPRAQPAGLAGVHDGRLRVRVGAPARDGRANREVEAVVAAALGLARGAVRLAAGERSRTKRLAVRGLAPAELRRALEKG